MPVYVDLISFQVLKMEPGQISFTFQRFVMVPQFFSFLLAEYGKGYLGMMVPRLLYL